jgi:hypothetical protein
LSESPPVRRVVEVLLRGGYRSVETPITVGSLAFDFAAAFVGGDHAIDLVIVIDTLVDSEDRIRQKITGLCRALDLVGSRRSVTVVIVGPSPSAATVDELGRVSRVLRVGDAATPANDEAIADALAVLLPLVLPHRADTSVDPILTLKAGLPDDEPSVEELVAIVDAAARGADAVTETFAAMLAGAFDDRENQESA